MNDSIAATTLAAAGLGRLIAQDTLLREPRNALLTAIGIRPRPSSARPNDLAEECRKGIAPLESGDHITVSAPSGGRAKIAEGLTCPSCCAWYATVAIRIATDRQGITTARWWRDTFAIWAAAAVITRKG